MEFTQALKVQGRVISALTLRETRARYGDSKLGFFWALFEPFAHIIVFIGLFSSMGRAVPIGDSIGIFILTGIIPWLLYSNIVGSVMVGLKSNQSLLGYPQVMPIDIVISKVILDAVTLIIVAVIFLIMFSYLGYKIRIDSFLRICEAYGLLALFATGIGLINAAIIPNYPSYKNIFRAFSRPLYFISGVFFTADFLPREVFELIEFNPILHIVEWIRSGFYPGFQSNLYDPEYAVWVCVSMFFIGLIVERKTSRRARQI